MDPRIAWYPTELTGNAYATWSTIWMLSQMSNSSLPMPHSLISSTFHSTPNLHPNQVASLNSNGHHSPVENLIPILSSPALAHTKFDLNPDSAYNVMFNGLKSRKQNKASTFGFNFPNNQQMLNDPMSTPWLTCPSSFQQPQTQGGQHKKQLTSVNSNGPAATVDFLLSTSNSSTSSPSCSSSTSSHNNDDFFQSNLSNVGNLDEDEYVAGDSLDFNSKYHSEGIMNLHKEILLFSEYIAPTLEELYIRNEIIYRITNVVKEQFPFAQVDIFGSYKTGNKKFSFVC